MRRGAGVVTVVIGAVVRGRGEKRVGGEIHDWWEWKWVEKDVVGRVRYRICWVRK